MGDSTMARTMRAIELLQRHATGREQHINRHGRCPGPETNYDERDSRCPICRAIDVVGGYLDQNTRPDPDAGSGA